MFVEIKILCLQLFMVSILTIFQCYKFWYQYKYLYLSLLLMQRAFSNEFGQPWINFVNVWVLYPFKLLSDRVRRCICLQFLKLPLIKWPFVHGDRKRWYAIRTLLPLWRKNTRRYNSFVFLSLHMRIGSISLTNNIS